MATYFGTAWSYSHMVGYAGSPARTVYVDVTLTRSKVKVNVTVLLNFRQLAKPCMLVAMTAAPLRGFLVCESDHWRRSYDVVNISKMAVIDFANQLQNQFQFDSTYVLRRSESLSVPNFLKIS